ncbi:prevent-host-death family protein [Candidatus Electrothrix aarhusensis]|jgi:prevent-host-death family protein|uniref:Antitoxin n=1 Tax=Candidatus Electrothrix aarhusensis TaxID=1859131 RepID=A0A444IZN6_9BACT|nr:prevent-host-death family protein [Candidatus Electrothrix aarhusensis]
MPQLNISEVKSRFSATIARVVAGETVIVCNRNKPVAEIIPIKQQETFTERPVGLGRKRYPNFKLADNFNDPLPDDILAYFTGEKE